MLPPLLKSCACANLPNYGMGIHGYLIKCGLTSSVFVGNILIPMYMRFRKVQDGYKVFEQMPDRDGHSFNSLVCGFGSNGLYREVLVFFEKMLELDFFPCWNSISHTITACGELGSIEKGRLIHDLVTRNGFLNHVPTANALISMYTKMNRLDLGRSVFDQMRDRDLVSWNSLITAYARNGNSSNAFDMYIFMKKDGNFIPNRITFLGLLLACGQSMNLALGKCIHGKLICMGQLSDLCLGTALIDMYSKCGRLVSARIIFDEDLSVKSLVSWNSLIAGYSKSAYHYEAMKLFEEMTCDLNLKPDSITFANTIPSYASLKDKGKVQLIHAVIVKSGLDLTGDIVLGTSMIDAYGKCSDLKAAVSLFNTIDRPNTATWNAIIGGHNLNQHAEIGILLFRQMLLSKVSPDSITMVMLLQSCGELEFLKQGITVHGYCVAKGFLDHLPVGNAIVDMYLKCGCLRTSEMVFISISLKNIVTWNTMINGYVKYRYFSRALRTFHQMLVENQYRPDSVTMISYIQASSAIMENRGCGIAHGYILKLGLDLQTLVLNSLIDAYAKNGSIENARDLFNQMGHARDRSSWNVIIAGCGMNGQGREACNLFSQMEKDGYKPNFITFTSILSSCSHSGLIQEGCHYFYMMATKYNIKPSLEHWTCVVDMLGRAGRLEEALRLIENRVCQNINGPDLSDCDAIWGALLSACRMNMDVETGVCAGERLLKLAPDNCGYHSLLSNLYSSIKQWDEAAKTRRVFEEGLLIKKPGLSTVKL